MHKVAIIIPCYNQGQYVKEAIESAINQTYKDIEIICVNDGSNDNTSEVVKELVNNYKNIIFIDEQENRGVVYSRNIAIEATTAEYILPLDADDTIESTYVEKAAKILSENTNIGIVYCNAKYFDNKNSLWKLPKFDKNNILFANQIFATAMFRKSDFEKVGKYNFNMTNGYEDWDLWLSMIEKGVNVYKIDEVLFNYRKHDTFSRSDFCREKVNTMLLQLFKNHQNLYFNSEIFFKKLFNLNIDKSEKHAKKYKKLFNILLPLVIIELLIILILIIKSFCCGEFLIKHIKIGN